MAVEQKPATRRLAKDFWRYFRRGVIALIFLLQIGLLVSVGALLYGTGLWNTYFYWAILVVMAALSILSSIITYKAVSRPVRDLLAAIIHITGEPTDTTPPNPNSRQYERSGFKDVLETIYQLASKKDEATADTDQPASNDQALATTTTAPNTAHNPIEDALNETVCGFVVMDHQRRITFANKAAPVGTNQQGQPILELIFNGDNTLDRWLAECEQSAVKAEQTWSRVANKLPGEEDRRFFDVFASYDKGAASEVVITLIDRTKLYEVGEEELDFIAFAAHELRGPITVIRGYLDVLSDELGNVLSDDQKELFRRLTVSANRLSGYINNILNTSRYDRRHLKMHLTETSIAEIYNTIADDMQLRAQSQNRLLTVNIPNDLPTIAADTASLGEVLSNLIDNAIKYSNEGGAITVSAGVKGENVEVIVEDHGIGMPGNVVSNLFQKFYRSHRSRETVAGTGIGLYISKAIVESHGGNISVRSEDGRGSTFTVSLPTYQVVADRLKAGDSSNEGIIEQNEGWINNHSMYRG